MDAVLNAGIDIILFLQGLGAWLETPMRMVTFLGNEEFYLLFAPVIYWCIDIQLGLRLGIFLMISGGVNWAIKIIFHAPRPYWYDTDVQAMSAESSFGIPSGHSQHAVVIWGTVAHTLRKRWAWIAAITLMLLIGFSRMYLGVHFPSDVLLGWTIGLILLWLFVKLEPPVRRWLAGQSAGRQIAAAFGGSLLLVSLGILARLVLGAWTLPAGWVQNAALTASEAEPIEPLAFSGLISNAGALFGLSLGAILLPVYGGCDIGGPLWKRVARFFVGLVGVLLFWRGLGMILPAGEHLLAYLFRYLRYALIGMWITGLAPWIFVKLGLAQGVMRSPVTGKSSAASD